MSQSYLDVARQGKNNWWRYLLAILLILFFWLIVGSIIAGILLLVFVVIPSGNSGLDSSELQLKITEFLQTPSLAAYVTINVSFIFLWLGLFVSVKWLHQRKFFTLVSPSGSVNFRRLFSGFGVWFVLQVILMALGLILNPDNYEFVFNPAQWFLILPFALLLTPMQAFAEELLFRGYFLQGLGLLTKQPLVLIIINGILFMVPHLVNPEMSRGPVWLALSYFSVGVFTAIITLKDNRLELALGLHAANNLTLLFISTNDSVLPAPAIWLLKDTGDPRWDLLIFWAQIAVFYYILLGRKTKNKLAEVANK
ncbi:MAG: CPBP family intramembrane metalloprotease [Nostocaceae cyanobacterium]|nr:CPBP family intramembrane metalloprotease [Nostocaceae cyanobacterium]